MVNSQIEAAQQCSNIDDYLDMETPIARNFQDESRSLGKDSSPQTHFRIHNNQALDQHDLLRPISQIKEDEEKWLTESSVFDVIPYEEVEVQQDSGREFMLCEDDTGVEQGQDNEVDEQGEGGPCIVLREREYRTARHMALMETQITRRLSSGNQLQP